MYLKSVNPLLREGPIRLIQADEFKIFSLVGGTALRLQIEHGLSVDIDLFANEDYGSIDFNILENYLMENLPYLDNGFGGVASTGKSYLIGAVKDRAVKLDVYYSNEKFIEDAVVFDGVRKM